MKAIAAIDILTFEGIAVSLFVPINGTWFCILKSYPRIA